MLGIAVLGAVVLGAAVVGVLVLAVAVLHPQTAHCVHAPRAARTELERAALLIQPSIG